MLPFVINWVFCFIFRAFTLNDLRRNITNNWCKLKPMSWTARTHKNLFTLRVHKVKNKILCWSMRVVTVFNFLYFNKLIFKYFLCYFSQIFILILKIILFWLKIKCMFSELHSPWIVVWEAIVMDLICVSVVKRVEFRYVVSLHIF